MPCDRDISSWFEINGSRRSARMPLTRPGARVVDMSLFQDEGVHIPLIMKGGQFYKKTFDILGVQARPSLWTLHPARDHEKALASCLTSIK